MVGLLLQVGSGRVRAQVVARAVRLSLRAPDALCALATALAAALATAALAAAVVYHVRSHVTNLPLHQ